MKEFTKKAPHTVWQLTGKETPQYNASIEVDIAEIWRMVVASNEANGTPVHKRYYYWSDNFLFNVHITNIIVGKNINNADIISIITNYQSM